MKRTLKIIKTIFLVGLAGCILTVIAAFSYFFFYPFDDFQWCDRTITTDKKEYVVGDSILLTVTITPQKADEKEIRIYENFENFTMWATFHRQCYDHHPNLCSFSVDSTIKIDKKQETIKEYTITPDKPFKYTFIGTIKETKDKRYYIIDFLDLGTYFIDKEEYKNSVNFGVYGFWMPIKPHPLDSLEDYAAFCEIKIRDKITAANKVYKI